MTSCSGVPADQYLEDYLQGTLPENDAATFEDHYFACPVCLAQVETLQAVQRQLRTQPRQVVRKPIAWPIRFTMVAAIAATLIAVAFTFYAKRQPAQPTVATGSQPPAIQGQPQQPGPAGPSVPTAPTSAAKGAVSQLADLTLPAFRLPNLRGQSANPLFDSGMKAYVSQDCPRALRYLSQVPAPDEASTAAHFYSGVCQMHEGNMPAASRSLRGVANAGDSPQQEAALYYLAQISLAGNDSDAAQRYLSRTAALHGDFERRARAQLAELRKGAAIQ
jgi:anti-sigma factor RsiW